MAMPPRVKARSFEKRRVSEFVGSDYDGSRAQNLIVERKREMGMSGIVIGDDGGNESVVEENRRIWDSIEDRECVG